MGFGHSSQVGDDGRKLQGEKQRGEQEKPQERFGSGKGQASSGSLGGDAGGKHETPESTTGGPGPGPPGDNGLNPQIDSIKYLAEVLALHTKMVKKDEKVRPKGLAPDWPEFDGTFRN